MIFRFLPVWWDMYINPSFPGGYPGTQEKNTSHRFIPMKMMWKTPLTWQHITWLNVGRHNGGNPEPPNTSGPRPPSKMGFLRTLMYLLSELCPGESLGQHMSNVMSNVQISFKDIRHKYQTSIELGEGVHIFFTNIIVISLLTSFESQIFPFFLLTQQRVEGKSVLCQCFATPNMSLVFCYKKSNMTKSYKMILLNESKSYRS